MCPECSSAQVTVSEYDFGVCLQTGYHDAGERFHCLACGATGDAADACPPRDAETLGSFRAENGGALNDCTISLASDMKVGRHLRSSGRHRVEPAQ